ncbi:glycosyltransferase [Pampinifervens florentissimum]|uniref:glycosyltransferase n=1 Tax=Pampinifervens florentissimum TaxID=1632019 RepID=UPI0013B4828C|nr:glycosyltransferase [Hydrogenobacter sp. T-8]QID34011.1 glycosyltransferase [Hydrogenobacter sp. T-8]
MGNYLAKADLHLHSKASNLPGGWFSKLVGCPESLTEPMEIYRRLKERGMSFITITDHNTINGVLELAHLPEVFISCEYTVEIPEEKGKVHVLVYGITEAQHQDLLRLRNNIYDFVKYLKSHRIAHSLAHPLYSVQGTKITRSLLEKLVLLFDNWEVINGTRGDGVRYVEESIARAYDGWDKIHALAERHRIEPQRIRDRITFTAGSDDHGGMDVGRTWTAVEGAISKEDFLKGLWEGKTQVGTEELGDKRLLNMVCRVGYDFLKSKNHIPSEVRPITDYVFMHSDNPMVGMLLRNFLGIKSERSELLREIAKKLPSFTLERFLKSPSPQTLGELCLSLMAHGFPAFLKYAQKREEEKIKVLGREFGILNGRSPKVAYLTDTYHHINGVARSAKLIRQIALEEDLPFTIIVSNSQVKEEEKLINLEPIVEIPTPFYEELKMGLPNLIELMDLLEREGFTQVHIATPGPLGLMGFLVGKILRLRITFAFHTDIPTYARTYTGDPEVESLLWKAFVFLGNISDRFFVPSEHYKKLFVSKGLQYSKISTFKRGVDTELFSPYKRDEDFWSKRLGVKKHQRVILYVGRVSKEKGLDTFLYTARCFPEDLFVIVGDGPYRKEIEGKKPKNVHLLGYMVGEELATAYASSDVFLFPSETETYGQVVLEAMASGLPVVVSSKGASHEHVQEGVNGFIATKPEDFIEKLSLLLSSENLRRSMSQEALYYARSLDMRKTYIDYMLAIAGLGRLVHETC